MYIVTKLSYRKTAHPRCRGGYQGWEETEVSDTLNEYDNTESRVPILIIENHPNDSRVKFREDGVFQTLSSRMGTGGGNVPMIMKGDENMIVRRLSPTECTRLQGFPDGWVDIGDWVDSKGKVHKDSDSAKYKALGNSIALPFWSELAGRICSQYERPVEMGSLFDGIGGFPLAFTRHGGKAVWASEIEDFCIAVTKKHFPEEEGESE